MRPGLVVSRSSEHSALSFCGPQMELHHTNAAKVTTYKAVLVPGAYL